MNRPSTLAFLLAAVLTAVSASAADSGEEFAAGTMFRRGRQELTAGGGYGVDNGKSYLILALGGGYYLRDGLSAGLTGEAWLGSQPQISSVSPYVRQVFLDSPWRHKPYAGVFYRRTFYSHQSPPIDSAGVRSGLVFPLSPRAFMTAGLALEHDFNTSPYIGSSKRDSLYPEISLQFGF